VAIEEVGVTAADDANSAVPERLVLFKAVAVPIRGPCIGGIPSPAVVVAGSVGDGSAPE